jgi:hypothetical protein
VLPAGISLNLVMLLNNLIIENYGFALINVVSAFILTAILEVFKAALSAAKKKAKLKSHEATEYDQVVHVLESELCIDHLD